jgi:phosphoglycolate phosphatase
MILQPKTTDYHSNFLDFARPACHVPCMTDFSMIKGLLFDKDGTLFDYTKTWMPLNHRAALMAARGDQSKADELMIVGGWLPELDTVSAGSLLGAHTNFEIAEVWIKHLGNDWEIQDLYEAISHTFNTYGLESAVAVTDLPLILGQLKSQGYTLGVATSDNEFSANSMLKRFEVDTLFDYIAGYDSGHGAKPGPGMVEGFCRQTGLTPAQVAVIGDNSHDVEMGNNAGVACCIGVLTGNSSYADLIALTEHVLDDITGIPALFASQQT